MSILTLAQVGRAQKDHWLDTYIQAINNESVQWALYKFGGLGGLMLHATGDDTPPWSTLHTWPQIAANEAAMTAILASDVAGVVVRSQPDAVRSVILSTHFSPVALDDMYWGWIPGNMLITGDNLNTEIFANTTNAQNSDAGWLAFVHGNALKMVAKKTFKHTISWNAIYNAGAVFGTGDNGPYNSGSNVTQDASVTIGGKAYTVRLLTGADANPFAGAAASWSCAENRGGGSEWNELLYRVHVDAPNCSEPFIGLPSGAQVHADGYHGGAQVGRNWASLTDIELNMDYLVGGDGTYGWCQETMATDTTRRCYRGHHGVATFITTTSSSANADFGWRPCLELV